MASSKQTKKGGQARFVIKNATQNDTFTVPHGFRIRYLGVETLSTLSNAANMTVGVSAGTYETAVFSVTSVVSAVDGTLTWGGGASGTVTLAAGDILSTTLVATKIAATGASGGWVVTSSGAVVTMTGVVPGAKTNPTIALGTATDITFSAVTSVNGAIDSSIVSAAAVSQTKYVVADFAAASGKGGVGSTTPNTATFALSTSSATAGTIIVCGQTVYLVSGDVATGTTLATKLATVKIPGVTITNSTADITISSETGIGAPMPSLAFGTATGITYTLSSTTSADPTYYINFSAVDPESNVNVYILLDKLN